MGEGGWENILSEWGWVGVSVLFDNAPLCVVPAHNALSKDFYEFSQSNFTFACKQNANMLVLSSNCSKFTKIHPFLIVSHISPAFLKYTWAMPVSKNYFNIWYQWFELPKCVMCQFYLAMLTTEDKVNSHWLNYDNEF